MVCGDGEREQPLVPSALRANTPDDLRRLAFQAIRGVMTHPRPVRTHLRQVLVPEITEPFTRLHCVKACPGQRASADQQACADQQHGPLTNTDPAHGYSAARAYSARTVVWTPPAVPTPSDQSGCVHYGRGQRNVIQPMLVQRNLTQTMLTGMHRH